MKALILAALPLLVGCAHISLSDCGQNVLGKDEARIRSSKYRMLLASEAQAAAKFWPYAAMANGAYDDPANCTHTSGAKKGRMTSELAAHLRERGWEVAHGMGETPCQRPSGLYYQVWRNEKAGTYALVFRGTENLRDTFRGNLHWLTRYLPVTDQYKEVRILTAKSIEAIDRNSPQSEVITVGHSLGGGLAQHVLYTFPRRVNQSFTFAPSSVTGFVEQPYASKVAACECTMAFEPRVYRVYESGEILSNLRLPHKLLFKPHRHIQEVRFAHKSSHSIQTLTDYLRGLAPNGEQQGIKWFAARGMHQSGLTCTAALEEGQRSSCTVSRGLCPQ